MKKLRKQIFDTIDKYKEEADAWQKAAQSALVESAKMSDVANQSMQLAEESAKKLEDLAEFAASNLEEIRVLLTDRTELRTHALETAITLERRQLAYAQQEDMSGFVHIANQQLAGVLTLLPKILGLSGTETLKLVREMAADKTVIGKDEQ